MSRIYISSKGYTEIKQMLSERGHQPAFIEPCKTVSEPLAEHMDLFMCKLGTSPKSPVFHGDLSILKRSYPLDVPYNAVVTERFMICNLSTVSADLMKNVTDLYPAIQIINVKQGYTKCNVIPLDDRHFITEDRGIYKALQNVKDAECLLVDAGHVLLPGFNRGFIGGCCGRIGDDIWFNGDIKMHPDCKRIESFIRSCGFGIIYVSDRPLNDIGSIIEESII